jgi:uncharacterized SAM-binding protein YcdF (DUF218 family)
LNSTGKNSLSVKLTVLWLVCYELIVLFIMETYKYWVNSGFDTIFSRSFLGYFKSNFNLLYTGNLFWIIVCLISLIAIINMVLHFNKINPSALKTLLIFTILALLFLIFAFFQGKLPKESFYDNVFSLSPKGLQTISVGIFAVIHMFLCVSLCVISFSALNKFYVFRSIWLTILLIAAGYSVVLLFSYTYKDDYKLLVDNKKTVQAGTVLGAAVWGGNRPSPVLRERINKGYDLYTYGIIRYIVLTGGGSPGEMTEAEVSKKELLKKGVKENDIIIENKSNSTLEQISYLSSNLYKKNNWKDVVIISDNFHLLRTKQICKFFGINAYTVASETPLSTESNFNYCVRESFAVILFWLFGIG